MSTAQIPYNTLSIGGVDIKTRHVSCGLHTPGKTAATPVLQSNVGMTVYLTNACNATCSFCSNTDAAPFKFDFDAFKRIWDETIAQANVTLVSFTGGEPTLNLKDFYRCADYIKQTKPNTPLTIMTNGVLLERVDHPLLVQISVSRHHWDHAANERILGFKLKPDYLRVPTHGKIKLACNIIKGEVDTPEAMFKVLDLAVEYDIPTVGFVGLMQINDFTKDNRVSVPKMEGKGVFTYENWKQDSVCECARSIYNHPSGKMIRFYYRHNQNFGFDQGGLIVFKYNKVQSWY